MSTGSSTQVARRGVFPRLRDARIRSKLALILLVPLAAVIVLATTRLVDIGQRASAAGQVEELTKLDTDISALTQLLHTERMAAAAYLAAPAGAKPDAYDAAVRNSDAQIAVYRSHRAGVDDSPGAVADRLARIDDHLNTMDATRTAVSKHEGIAVAEAVSRYGVVITDLVAYGDSVSQLAGDGDIADSLRALSAFARAKAGTAEQEAVSYAARVADDLSEEQRVTFIATQTSQQEALTTFSLVASAEQRALADKVVSGDAVNLVDGVATQLGRGESVPAADITEAFGAVVDLMRWAEQQLEAKIVKATGDDRDSVVRQAAIESALVVIVLIIAIALAVILARSLNMSLRRLREGALAVANRDLPDAVTKLRDAKNLGEGGADDIVRQVREPIQLPNRDEIGQVAQAFNVVHREAVRIAAEQAALRTSVSTMFLNLARRSQSLVDRMIGELDMIERNEEDPKRLAQLFELDHLATRMRRNDENLLVLAGADSSPPRREDALVVDALRAAQSEVELYNRIEFGTVDTDVSIAALAVNDVVRLVAELLDNATRFSPPTTVVVADGRRIRDYVVIQVEDRGLGMSEEQMDQLNRRLAEPPSVDVAAFRLMGLAVVSRLASRYGIKVELRANLEGGTVAQVTLPSSIVVTPRRYDTFGGGPRPELGAAPSGGWDGRASRAATATLPTIEPPAPEPVQEMPSHPQLPVFPSQRPPSDPEVRPTPNRPPLPTRVSKTISQTQNAPTMNGFTPTMQTPTVTPPVSAPPVSAPPVSAPPVSAPTGGWGAALAAMPPVPAQPMAAPVEDRNDSPIFVQMQQSWFRNHDGASQEQFGMPTAGYAPPPNAAPAPAAPTAAAAPAPAAAPASPAPAPAPAPAAPAPVSPPPPPAPKPEKPAPTATGHNGPSVPRQRPAEEDRWKTAADDGWKRAMAAAEPVDAGTTRSGLPKRVPQAQLVPGGVQPGPKAQNRRSPDEVRGLLSAYHRGVQRGRTDGTAESAASQAKETD
ncbi:nitrate- and nitrite sensing domain-containing protein [Paractinoplanes atraurantiacus]|uniref:histidine kinase n=1 Tax=Paractinoplanes atraurantiacus TaxID=1036182 RepID=A0A285IVQ0_9ACTN|nr:nitrate- and nitrite sensing domain-containing protein [Actinoplanes atraurantiacus]SNY51903.1 Signal transduction histidine kinase [Actinoplanes atraurantiacus]